MIRRRIALLGASFLSCSTALWAEESPDLPPASTLKTLSLDELLDMTVTSVSKRPEKLLAAASAIQVVTGDDIRRAGANSLPEALRLATNLEVAQIDARQWAISARGFNNLFADKLLVLIDGRSLYTPLYAGVYWDVQDTMLEDVDRIEVISGPGATQWGANAVNGVINVTTKSARETQGGLLVAGAGSQLRDATALRYGGMITPHLAYRVYAKYADRADSVRPGGNDSGDAWHIAQTGFRADWDGTSGEAVTVQGDAYGGVMGQQGPENVRASGENVLGRWTRAFSEAADMKLQVYYDRTHRRIPGSLTQDIGTYDLDYQDRFPIGARNDFVWGADYRFVADSVINTPSNAFVPASVDRQWFGGFLQDQVTIVPDRVRLTVGSKLEHNDYTGFEVEPSGRLAWTPQPTTTLWTAISRAVREPSRIDRDLYSPATPPYRVEGSSDVVAEKVEAYEAGFKEEFNPRLSASLSGFYNVYTDLRSLEPIHPPRAFPVEASNGLVGTSSGAELALHWRVAATWRLEAGWIEMRVHSARRGATTDRATRDSIVRDPNRQGQLRSVLDLGRDWELDTTVRFVSAIDRQSVPGYTEASARLGWQPTPAWEVSLTGENLLHSHHPEFNPPGSRREVPRSIFGKVAWRF